ncbi:MAG: hypothetical protein R3F20_02595 [Planctomycetota bacterium]
MRTFSTLLATLLVCVGLTVAAGSANGQGAVMVTSDIATSTTWTANNTYNLQDQIYVLPGATLTIEAGTVIASTTNLGGSLAVAKGAQIHVLGTQDNPVIMTSTADVATWTAGDPKTGTWRVSANEWGNLTLMGDGYISEDATPGNVPTPNASNVASMEGLVADFAGDTKVLYGGGNDDDDSGTISHLSLRYGGKVIGLGNELNGLSLGGIGRGTDIHHVEIMNNVDDGVEIWGGTVNLRYMSIWNIGDDSFDVDQGWRGTAQFILIVQGYSLVAGQGSGVGDNCFETDGAEDSDWQPVTTARIANATVIGQPLSGDHGTAWRDNARVQYHNCIFMDLGDRAVSFDNLDGDGASGYGINGTLSWADTWVTDYTVTSPVNPGANPGALYTAQTSGKLAEIKDTVFFNNNGSNAYTEANNRNVFAAANNNVLATMSPIQSITRAATVVVGSLAMQPVIGLDPRPANDALTAVNAVQNDGVFNWAGYRGAFAPSQNWLCGWTASEAFGFTTGGAAIGVGQPGDPAIAALDINGARNASCDAVGTGTLNGPHYATVNSGDQIDFTFMGAANQPVTMWVGPLNISVANFASLSTQIDVGTFTGVGPFFFAADVVGDGMAPGFLNAFFNTGPTGSSTLSIPAIVPPGTTFNFQAVVYNPAVLIRSTNAVQVLVQ